MPNQYNAADLGSVPREYYDNGEQSLGPQPGSGLFAFNGGLRVNGANFRSVTDQTYPHAEGSYAGGAQQPFGFYNPNVSSDGDYQAASGMFAPGSGLVPFTSVKFAAGEGARVNEVDYPGYVNSEPLDASGITHTFYDNPTTINNDPWLDSDV